MLTIQNYQRIKGIETHCFTNKETSKWIVASIDEHPQFYKLALMPEESGVFNIHRVEYIWVFRNLNENGFEYQIESQSIGSTRWSIHCQYLKDPIHLLEWISSKLLPKLC